VAALAVLIALVLQWNSRDPALAQSGTADAARFLEQATFGPTMADVALVQSIGKAEWINQQFSTPESPIVDSTNGANIRNQLFLNMANGPDQLRQRVMFALSQTIVVSADKTGSGDELAPWVRLLSASAFGNYRQFIKDVSLSPTMGKYLDNAYNRKAVCNTANPPVCSSAPNENYARELMQLFTIGLWEMNMNGTLKLDGSGQPIPTYSQDTLTAVARALTGWTYPPRPGQTSGTNNPEYFVGQMVPGHNASNVQTTHDTAAKTLPLPPNGGAVLPAGQTMETDLEQLMDILFNHPNTPPFVATRLIRSLVTSNPSPQYIERVANAFANNGSGVRGDMRAVVTAILTDPEAQTFAITDGRLKDPVLEILGLGRALGAAIGDPNGYMYWFSGLNEEVLNPGTVFSFFSPLAPLPGNSALFGPEFEIYPPAVAVQRGNFIYALLRNSFGTSFQFNLAPFQALAGTNVPGLVDLVNQRLLFGRMTNELRDLIIAATNAVPATNPNERAFGALYLAALSSEFSVYADNNVTVATNVQPPTGVATQFQVGNQVTLKWNPPLIGPAPTAYILEGGVRPGETLATIPINSTQPVFTIAAPPGNYYVRIRTRSGSAVSRPSLETRIFVETAAGPTAPTNLIGVAGGSALNLAWVNTYGGGPPTSMLLDVRGALVTSLPIPLGETFSYTGVPAGTYTFSVREVNAAGSSGGSNSVTLTFPTTCTTSLTPSAPVNFTVTKSGTQLTLSWQPSLTGRPATSFEVNSTGAYVGSVPTTSRTLSANVNPGTYNLRVRALNACGAGPYTATQTIVVP
jgi:uncharacterized protein (DUF1800 family)